MRAAQGRLAIAPTACEPSRDESEHGEGTEPVGADADHFTAAA
jgi:hypothetical protein